MNEEKHAIERRVRIVQCIRETAMELDVRPGALCLARRSSERLLVGIQPDDLHVREELLHKNDQAPGSTSDVEHAVNPVGDPPGAEGPVSPGRVRAAGERLVEGQEPVGAHSRKEWPSRFGDHRHMRSHSLFAAPSERERRRQHRTSGQRLRSLVAIPARMTERPNSNAWSKSHWSRTRASKTAGKVLRLIRASRIAARGSTPRPQPII
jgi:hypothetical protein